MPDTKSLPLPDPPPEPIDENLNEYRKKLKIYRERIKGEKDNNVRAKLYSEILKYYEKMVVSWGTKEIPLKDLRTLMYDRIFNDEGMKLGYVANVAMLLYDNLKDERLQDDSFRTKEAIRILELIFKG